MKAITQKSVGDWLARWRVFVFGGAAITLLLAGSVFSHGKESLESPKFGWILFAYAADSIGIPELKVPVLNRPAGQIVTVLEPAWRSRDEFRHTVKAFFWSPVVGYGLALIILILIGRALRREKSEDEHLRGSRLVDAQKLHRQIKKTKEPTAIELGGLPIPIRLESSHFLFAGTTGSGKSLAFLQLLESVRARRHRAIIVDNNGLFLKRFYRPGDIILNPSDSRSLAWSPFAEIREDGDASDIAKSIIPDAEGEAGEWRTYARKILSAALTHLMMNDKATNGELKKLLYTAENGELRDIAEGTAACRIFNSSNEKMAVGALAVLTAVGDAIEWLDPKAGKDAFSLRDFVEAEGSSWLFITYKERQFEAIKGLIAAQVDQAVSALLNMSESRERRLWFALDEFATLGRISSIGDLLTKARKYGGCAALGLQSISQLRETYGNDRAQTLLSCLGSWLVLRLVDEETAEYMSRFFGDEEVRRQSESGSKGGDGSGNWREEITRRRVVMASELTKQEERFGVLSLAGNYPLCALQMPIPDELPDAAPAFVPQEKSRPAEPSGGSVKELNFEGW